MNITDLRNLKVFADTPEERSHSQWLINDGQSLQSVGAPAMPAMDRSYSVSSDSQGGPGSSVAYANAAQKTFISDDLFAGFLLASANARANGAGYYGQGTALSLFDVQFQVEQPQDYDFVGSGSGTMSMTLGQVGGSMLWSHTDSAIEIGHLQPGLYELVFALRADGLAYGTSIVADKASGQFSFSLGAEAKSVPDLTATWLLMLPCLAMLIIARKVMP